MIKLIRVNRFFPNKQTITVGIGDYKVASNPKILATYALGSCVAIILYDRLKRIGALIHAMLPEPKTAKPDNPIKYVKTSIPTVLAELARKGIPKHRLISALIGGANVLKYASSLSIGERNVRAAREVLKEKGIPIVAEDVGGNISRSVFFDLEEAVLYVSSPKRKVLFG